MSLMPTMKHIKSEEGTSLIEVITVAAMSVVVAFSVYLLLDSIGPLQIDVQNRTELQGEARIAMNAIATEVRGRKAFFDDDTPPYEATMDSDHLHFTRTSSGPITTPVIYFFTEAIAGSPGKYRLKMATCNFSNCDPTVAGPDVRLRTLSENVINGNSATDPIFTYFGRTESVPCTTPEPDTIMCKLVTGIPAGTRWVRVHLILDDDPSDTRRRYQTAIDVAIRNN